VCVTVSQRPAAAPPSATPPSPAPAQPSSLAQPASHAPVAVLQYWLALQAAGIAVQLTHIPDAVSHSGRPGEPAHPAFD
jgi:hypothetical protein